MTRLTAHITIVLTLFAAATYAADWSARDIQGKQVTVPSGKPALLLFLRPDQRQSEEAVAQAQKLLGKEQAAQVIVIVSGRGAEIRARQAASAKKYPWPIIADPEFAASGKWNVHVWPTTTVVDKTGEELAHVASLPDDYLKTVEAHLHFALGRISKEERDKRLSSNVVVRDSSQHKAQRHLRTSRRLSQRGLLHPALTELEKGLAIDADHVELKLAAADLYARLNRPDEALMMLGGIAESAAPPWRSGTIRARALIIKNQYAEAKPLLEGALKLNPKPDQAWYLLGIVHQQLNETDQAVAAFRKAYESTPTGRSSTLRGAGGASR